MKELYTRDLLTKDLIAGITLFVMLVPQGMAYAMLAGLPPVMGLYASTLPLLIYALFASSRHLSVGPTAITSLLVFSGISAVGQPGTSEYVTLVILLALMVGLFQFLFGVFKLGFIVRFISPSVLGGYTSAAAIIIALSQLKHLLGIDLGNYFQVHLLFYDVLKRIGNLHLITLLIGVCSITVLVLMKKVSPRIPTALLLILVSIVMVSSLGLNKEGVKIVGMVPSGFPSLVFPTITIGGIKQIILPALTIALLGFMESLAIGKSIADKEKYKINPNRELKALGLANIFGSFFQILPINGSFSRSAVNHQSGGATQMVSVFTGILILITLLFFTSYFYYLPNAVLAAIIIAAVLKLIDLRQFINLIKIKPVDGWSWLVTFLSTLFIGIQWGILIGAIFSFYLLLSRMFKSNIIELGYLEKEKKFRDLKRFPDAITLDDVIFVRIDSSLHFANIFYLEEKVGDLIYSKPKVNMVIMDFSGVNDMDTTACNSLEEFKDQLHQQNNIELYFVGMKGLVRDTINRAGWNTKYKKEIGYVSIEKLLEEKNIIIPSTRKSETETPFIYMI
ncbi:SulP family inorganic anion transporter [Robertmurraya korlensis]|uniref:SulP family inorganic anion transporter n=1 Tax=Robertmurraya korlensis TaxID=519977 RepID=UPI0020422977|nr:SulP family inorganic anion transporter [Robertmurraya korlensis]MCM3600441.1 SulP family inorganic anion transporter [Robertmurraya korlensis]